MGSPPITLFMTTIASHPALRQRQEYILRTLQVTKIPYTTYDLASDEDAKRLWRRKAPADKQQLPGILVGGKFPGTFAEFEDAVEHDELDIFLRRHEKWDPAFEEDRPMPEAKVVGVPGAMTPLEMTPDRIKQKIIAGSHAPSPLKKKHIPVNKRTNDLDAGEALGDGSLEGVKVTMDELRALVEELGLEGDDAGNLVKGLSDMSISKGNKGKPGHTEKKAEQNNQPRKAEPERLSPTHTVAEILSAEEEDIGPDNVREAEGESKEKERQALAD